MKFSKGALFTVTETGKQPKCPLIDDRVENMWHSTTRKDKILLFAATWVNLENIMLSKTSQTEKVKNLMISLICVI